MGPRIERVQSAIHATNPGTWSLDGDLVAMPQLGEPTISDAQHRQRHMGYEVIAGTDTPTSGTRLRDGQCMQCPDLLRHKWDSPIAT